MIVFTWDYHSSLSCWNGLRTQPILADEIQTFKALIVVHKLLQEGHPVVSIGGVEDALKPSVFKTAHACLLKNVFRQTIKEAHSQTGWLETCARTVSSDAQKG